MAALRPRPTPLIVFARRQGGMDIETYRDRQAMSAAAARHAGSGVRACLATQASARLVAATGASQFDFLDRLCAEPDIDWARVELFHLDEYVGLPIEHPASFRKYLLERLIRKVGIARYHLLDGEADAAGTAERVGRLLTAAPVDLAFVGIGENGHLAFNDPPADFATERPYLIVELDEACRKQQVGEGWFAALAEVPTRAISMSVRQILKARAIVAVVPERRKAEAVRICMEGPITPVAPASILRTHPQATLYLDAESASLLRPETRGAIRE
jgi:glucosamine-6-phosphate deaminase